ncbi:MAG: hypothetical protein HYT98_04635 [Candidatus Sungbacteria bacterium]|nr:hypothetical protein [Candidatus Sungbacteria bacterium]
MKKRNIVDDKFRSYSWVFFAQGYFNLAALACQKLLNSEEKARSKSDGLNIPYTPDSLFVPILFNIKHGIEIFIKTVDSFAFGEYTDGHDINDLFTELNKKIDKKRFVAPPPQFYNSITQREINNLPQKLGEIKPLISYFYYLDILRPKVGQYYKIIDTKNDVLRYPDNKAGIQIDWNTVLISQIRKSDIEEIFKKLRKLSELFNDVACDVARLTGQQKN